MPSAALTPLHEKEPWQPYREGALEEQPSPYCSLAAAQLEQLGGILDVCAVIFWKTARQLLDILPATAGLKARVLNWPRNVTCCDVS